MSALIKVLDRIGDIINERAGYKPVPVKGISKLFRNGMMYANMPDNEPIITPESQRFSMELERLRKTIMWKAGKIEEGRNAGRNVDFHVRELGFLQDLMDAGIDFSNGQQRLFRLLMDAHNKEVRNMQDMIEQLEVRLVSVLEMDRVASESHKIVLEQFIAHLQNLHGHT